MHITYEYQTRIIYVDIDTSGSNSPLTEIDKRIAALRDEETQILQICNKLSQFIIENSLTPYNDDIVEYIRYFIREEEMKKGAGADNRKVIQGLQNMIEEYDREQTLYKTSLNATTAQFASSSTSNNRYEPEDIFDLVSKLYKLPIHGSSIRQQIDGLKHKQSQMNEKKEYFVQIPFDANSSTVMQRLKQIVDQH
jgi:hypothetical protein